MNDIPNKTLAVLLIVAIVISLGGSLLSLNRLGRGVTGFGTLGEVNVSITQQVALNLTFPGINFGSGYVTEDYAYLDSQTGRAKGWSESTVPQNGIVIENIGNQDLNVTFLLQTNTTEFLGADSAQFYYWTVDNESNSCPTGLVANPTSVLAADHNVSVCWNLTSDPNADTIDFNVNLTIPSSAQGTKGVLLTFEASISTYA